MRSFRGHRQNWGVIRAARAQPVRVSFPAAPRPSQLVGPPPLRPGPRGWCHRWMSQFRGPPRTSRGARPWAWPPACRLALRPCCPGPPGGRLARCKLLRDASDNLFRFLQFHYQARREPNWERKSVRGAGQRSSRGQAACPSGRHWPGLPGHPDQGCQVAKTMRCQPDGPHMAMTCALHLDTLHPLSDRGLPSWRQSGEDPGAGGRGSGPPHLGTHQEQERTSPLPTPPTPVRCVGVSPSLLPAPPRA